ncbi:MAG: aminoacyl-histidine dipeptidase [Bacteroidales bacterium]|nr:aminoacyl-histidine dipeptidase [Bacteroidales bacterium]
MNKELLNLEPKEVWKNFVELTKIPRPSKKEARIIKFMEDWAEERSLEHLTDEVGNVIVKKSATKGYENRKGIILQGHLDMVPQKNNDIEHDFEKDPITAYVDGDWVTAKGTTLGADNGMGVAAAMAVLESKTLEHGPIEVLMTIDEETGMTGAFNLKPGLLNGDILMNLDSEDEGELYIGCAGGIDATAYMKYKEEKVPKNHKAFKITVTGLKGGHSGVDIPLQRGNANKIIFRFLHNLSGNAKIRLASISGGDMRNAIPREAVAVITVKESDINKLNKYIEEFNGIVKAELRVADPGVQLLTEATEMPKFVIENKVAKKLYKVIRATPHGAQRFLDEMADVPETSTNLGIVKSEKGKIMAANLIRSSVDSSKDALAKDISALFKLAGAKVKLSGEYPGWKPDFDSPILAAMKKSYNEKYGKVPAVKIIHAGLECGVLGATYPNWDMISFGPTIRFPHSPDEKVNIETVAKFWDFLKETLKNAPVK